MVFGKNSSKAVSGNTFGYIVSSKTNAYEGRVEEEVTEEKIDDYWEDNFKALPEKAMLEEKL